MSWLPNGLELSCPAAQASAHPFSRNLAGKSRSNFPHASRVSCSELLGGHLGREVLLLGEIPSQGVVLEADDVITSVLAVLEEDDVGGEEHQQDG